LKKERGSSAAFFLIFNAESVDHESGVQKLASGNLDGKPSDSKAAFVKY